MRFAQELPPLEPRR